jgi:hypothetical protein
LKQERVLFRHVSERASPGIEVVAQRIFCQLGPLTLSVIEFLSLRIKSSHGVSMLVHKADFVSEITAFNHDRQCLPLTSLDINLLDVGRETGAEATSEYNHLIRLRAVASAVG